MFKKFLAMALGIFLFGVGQANAGGAVVSTVLITGHKCSSVSPILKS